jgi:hypothetical protein
VRMTSPVLLLTLMLTQTPDSPPEPTGGVPAYLPRSVLVGSFLGSALVPLGGIITPQLRVQWELTAIKTGHDALVFVLELGGGSAVGLPTGVTSFYEHTVVAGVGYRAMHPNGFMWGFHVATGPVFYGARFQALPSESTIGGWVEGRAQAGLKIGAVSYGVALSYANLYDLQTRLQSGSLVAGPAIGLFADWRP